jgi:hypothetical protein
MQIWDLRTGGIFETLKYDHAVTGLQFDTRKIIAATGENGIKVRWLASLLLASFPRAVLTDCPCRCTTGRACSTLRCRRTGT